MKTCGHCKIRPQASALNRWCKPCRAKWMRDHRRAVANGKVCVPRTRKPRKYPKYDELSADSQMKSRCRAYTNVLVKRRKLIKEPCACGSTDVQAHHSDYSKPRLVIWLCRPCHKAHHSAAA